MKAKVIAIALLLNTLGFTAVPRSVAQDANTQLQQAVCTQDWKEAIAIVDQLLAATPQQSSERNQLTTYRRRLQALSTSNANIPNWSKRCTTQAVPAPATNANTPAINPSVENASRTVRLKPIANNLDQLVAMAFDPSGRLFFTQKNGQVRLLVNRQLQAQPVISFNVDTCSERGLLGIAIDPAFNTNRYVYVYYTVKGNSACSNTTNQVVRFTEVNGVGQNPVTIFTSPAVGAGNHNGGNIRFGPDGKLYISVGDDSNPANSQNLGSPNGKIHRINPNGAIPTDNPFYGQQGKLGSIFAYGLRNSFDLDFDPVTGGLFASENGPNCDDEVNRIVAGYNYGWRPNYPCGDTNPNFNSIPALFRWTPTIAPTGITFYRSGPRKSLLMCSYNDGKLHRLVLSSNRQQILQDLIVPLPSGVNCNEDVETGSDGALYFVSGGGYTTATLYRLSIE
jgi:glucose/arabinose dehydrogenase